MHIQFFPYVLSIVVGIGDLFHQNRFLGMITLHFTSLVSSFFPPTYSSPPIGWSAINQMYSSASVTVCCIYDKRGPTLSVNSELHNSPSRSLNSNGRSDKSWDKKYSRLLLANFSPDSNLNMILPNGVRLKNPSESFSITSALRNLMRCLDASWGWQKFWN